MAYRTADPRDSIHPPPTEPSLWVAWVNPHQPTRMCTVLAHLYHQARAKAAIRLQADPTSVVLQRINYE